MGFIKNIVNTDISACEKAQTFLQSAMWGKFKSCFGWKALAFEIDWGGQSSALLVLCRKLAWFSFAYVPWGPQLINEDILHGNSGAEILCELAEKLRPFLADNTVFVRFEPPWLKQLLQFSCAAVRNKGGGIRRAAVTVQAPDSVVVNLEKSCEEILAAMKSKWRYNISLAAKKGVQVVCREQGAENNGLKIFYALLKETAVRDGIAIHSFEYYKTLFDVCSSYGKNGGSLKIRLYTAVHKEDTLAAIVVLFRGEWATYLYGASSNIKRNLMGTYALQWKAMQDAKEAGCIYYDLFGIPPCDDPAHPMIGLYRFKTGFGGRIISRIGTWDYPYKKAVYNLFYLAEILRKKMRFR